MDHRRALASTIEEAHAAMRLLAGALSRMEAIAAALDDPSNDGSEPEYPVDESLRSSIARRLERPGQAAAPDSFEDP